MKMYKAVVRNETTNDSPVIIEQERQFLGADFVKNALAWAFEESCEGGIDARHVSVTVTANGDPVCEYLMFHQRFYQILQESQRLQSQSNCF